MMVDDFHDLFTDIEEVNKGQCETDLIEVSPVNGCIGIIFPTKTKFTRHWEEKHRIHARKFLSPMAGCLAECRLKSDMKAHLRTKHEKDPQRLEAILLKCQSVVREKKGYIDPGLYIFKGASVTEETKTSFRQCRRLRRRYSKVFRTRQGASRTGHGVTRTEQGASRTRL